MQPRRTTTKNLRYRRMEPGIDSAPAFHCYSRLPCELRLCIIEQFLPELRIPGSANYKVEWRVLAKYATVDRQWQAEVEKRTFHCLRLHVVHSDNRYSNDNSTDLDDFEQKCVGDRINLVSRICLTIELEGAVRFPDTPRSMMTVHDDEMHPSTLHAGQKATEVFCRLFRILQKWTRKGQLLGLTYRLDRKHTVGIIGYVTRLSIDSSRFPEVPCVGSFRAHGQEGRGRTSLGIQPASVCQLLAKLPNVTHTDVNLQEFLELPEMAEILEGQSTLYLQGPRLKHLSMKCTEAWCRRLSLEPSSRSLQLNQSIYAMTCRLEEVRLRQVVNVPSFLRHSCGANGRKSQSPPAWPNLKKLFVGGVSAKGASNGGAIKGELHDSISHALAQMPNLTDFVVVEFSEYHRHDLMVWMQVPPRHDRSAMPDARMCWNSPVSEPERETVDTWRKIMRSQWHCGLVYDPHVSRDYFYCQWGIVASRSLHHDPL